METEASKKKREADRRARARAEFERMNAEEAARQAKRDMPSGKMPADEPAAAPAPKAAPAQKQNTVRDYLKARGDALNYADGGKICGKTFPKKK